jgi:ketosteroid isomerase-like protein
MTESDINDLRAFESIRQLVAHYAVAIDRRDFEALIKLFVSDVQVGSEFGRDALRRSFEDSMRRIDISILNTGTHAIDLRDDTHATGIVYCKGELKIADSWVHQAIVYDDQYRVENGTWLFVRRKHQLFYGAAVGVNPLGLPPANWPEHSTGMGTVPASWESWQRYQRSVEESAGDKEEQP